MQKYHWPKHKTVTLYAGGIRLLIRHFSPNTDGSSFCANGFGAAFCLQRINDTKGLVTQRASSLVLVRFRVFFSSTKARLCSFHPTLERLIQLDEAALQPARNCCTWHGKYRSLEQQQSDPFHRGYGLNIQFRCDGRRIRFVYAP